MAIYHLEAKVISRGAGRSAVAASAYMSCSEILNDYDGVQHDYTRKQGLIWEQIFLPDNAPKEWHDRSTLWNTVESNEKTKDSRLAREFVVALPIELNLAQQKLLLIEYIQANFVTDGMCADVCIHDTDGHNPHAHIMLTVRPLNENGTWQYKTEKEYLCIKDGEEKGFTAIEFKAMQADGWEKQYQYNVGKKKVYMTASEATKQGLERLNKYPKSTKFGRQNPITERWNSEEQLLLWRKNWADTANLHLEKANCNDRIDHRSHKERGIDEQSTIHEGIFSKRLKNIGIISDRAELNRQIKADNALIRTLKAEVKRILKTVKDTVPQIAEAMEKIRQSLLLFCYQVSHITMAKNHNVNYLAPLKHGIKHYTKLCDEIKLKNNERKSLQADKKATSILNLPKQHDLSRQITELTEDLEEIRIERNIALQRLECSEDKDISRIKKEISDIDTTLKKLNLQEEKYTNEINSLMVQYAELADKGADIDPVTLDKARHGIREDKEKIATEHIRNTYGKHFSYDILSQSKQEVAKLLGEDTQRQSVKERITRHKQITQNTEIKQKRKEQER